MKKKQSLRAAREEIKQLESALKIARKLNDVLRERVNSGVVREKEIKAYYETKLAERHVNQVGQLLQSIATINESVSKAILSVNNHL